MLDKGIQFILEACRSLFVFAAKRRHLTPYAENPFSALERSRMPIDHRRAIVLPTGEQAAQLLSTADDWAFSILVTLALTGLQSGLTVGIANGRFNEFVVRVPGTNTAVSALPIVHVEPLDVADVHGRLHFLLALDENRLNAAPPRT